MGKLPFYYVFGSDIPMVEKKFLPDIEKQYMNHIFRRFDLTIDEISVGKIVSEYTANDLFSEGKVFILRNADQKAGLCEELIDNLHKEPQGKNILILIGKNLNKTTKLGKLVKKYCMIKEFNLAEIKPFDLLDAINCRNITKILCQLEKLFNNDYHPLAIYSLLCNQMFLIKQVKEKENLSPERIASDLNQHIFRIKKTIVATRYWNLDQINKNINELLLLGDLLRSWRYDERMLLEMFLINSCL